MKRAHEGLHGYLKSLRGPGEVASLTPNPRLPVGPDAPLPIGFRPIPTSSQRPKPTNATIVYARTAVTDCNDLGQSQGAPPIAPSMAEGDLVFTHRMAPATRAPLGQNIKVISLKLLNEDLKRMGPLSPKAYQETFFDGEGNFKWSPDGVVNNLDGADPTNEFKDFAIANVAIQGFVRFSTLPFGDEAVGHNFPNNFTIQKGVRNGDRVYLVFSRSAEAAKRPDPMPAGYEDRHTYQFGLVLASHITTGKFKPDENALRAWRVGRVVDGNQSKNMVTVNVAIEPVAPEPMEMPYLLVPNPESPGKMVKEYVTTYSLQEQLQRLWLDGTNAARLAQIEREAGDRARRAILQQRATETVEPGMTDLQTAAKPASSADVSGVPAQE